MLARDAQQTLVRDSELTICVYDSRAAYKYRQARIVGTSCKAQHPTRYQHELSPTKTLAEFPYAPTDATRHTEPTPSGTREVL